MRSNKEVKADLIKSLELLCDDKLKRYGFIRTKNSIGYIRTLGDARQVIIFDTNFSPKYQLNAEAHIYPAMHFHMKSVSDATLQLVGGNKMLLADAPDMIFNQPIDFMVPIENRVRWFGSGFSEISQKILEIVNFIEKRVIPFFDELETPEDLVKLYEVDDERLIKQRHWYLFIAGAELTLGNKSAALAVLENNLGSPGLRKR